ncbi:MAG: cardiolipin synthase [Bacillota bacterium]|nr:cardiolipin synthase [Bacillota bacterium]
MTGELIWQIIDIVFFINIALAIVVVLFERKNPTVTVTWLLMLLFMPVIGFVLYVFLGQDLRKKQLFYLKKDEECELYPILHQQHDCLHMHNLPFVNPRLHDYEDILQLNLSNSQSLLTQNNEVKVFNEGQELFAEIIDALKKAQTYIHMEYYIIRNDTLGKEIIQILAQKAHEGVEVKLLYDGMGGVRLPKKFFRPLIEAGGKVTSFFPPFIPYINLRINYRNHRKICLIDGKEGFVGGFNIGDEYRGLSKRFGHWRDMHVKIQGSALDGLEVRFLLDWRYASKENVTSDKQYFPERTSAGTKAVQIVSSGPDSKWPAIKDGYVKLICGAKSNLYIQTPYFIPDGSISEALRLAALSGVDVRIVIPAKRDHMFVHWASLSFAGELLEAGVRFYLYKEGFLHSKMIVCDGFASTVGTSNLDLRSFNLNFEVNAFIYDEAIASDLEQRFLMDLNDSEEITMERYNARPILIRTKEAFSRLLSPIL